MSSEPFESSMRSSSGGAQSESPRQSSASGEGAQFASPYTSYSEWSEPEAEHDVQSSSIESQQLSNFLGWFSIGLGLTQLIAPKALGRAIGVGDHPAIMRALGVDGRLSGS